MAKNSFILFHDQKEVVDELTDEQAGKLFKAIYEYNVNKKINLKGALKLVFIPFKTTFDRNNDKWDETAKQRSKAGKKHKGNQYTRKKEMEQMEQVFQNGTNGTVSVSGSVNVSDNVSVSVSDIDKLDGVIPPDTPTPIFDYSLYLFSNYDENDLKQRCERFFKYYKEKKWQGVTNWKDKLEMWLDEDISKGKIKQKEKEEVDEAGFKHVNGRRVF
jgi:hypothetical protein